MRLILDPAVRLYAGGRVLAARGRIIRLSEAGPAALRALLADTATPAQRRLGERLIDAGFAHPRPAPRSVEATVVIPVKDDPSGLARCLAAFGHAPPARSPRVIVVDDGSNDPGAIATAARPARLVRRERCGGPAAARNTGLEHATTELVAFVDADTLPPPDWIERLAGHFDDPRVAAVAPRIRAANRRRSPLDMGPNRTVQYVPSAALLVRTPVRFDETLRYGEDVDLIWRLLDRGHRVVYDPSVVVLHHEADVLRRRFRYGTSAAPLAARHPTRLRHVVFSRPRPFALARVLHEKGVPRRVALVWTAQSLGQIARGLGNLATAYGIGVLWGKIGGLPTILGPRIRERN
ncbi:glycosyltransferase [Solirubrobacter taibaiensis]|nr:glycosyltransferase [Solirubrobacter taibaiensis]